MQIEGIVKSVSKQRSGRNAKGDWTMQWVEFVGGQRVKVWTRPDVSNGVNKFVIIDGVEEDTDNDGKACYVLKAGAGHISVKDREPGTQGPVSEKSTHPVAPSKPASPRTIDDYENVMARAIDFVSREFNRTRVTAQLAPEENIATAVGQVVTSYMAAYVRGDFAVTDNDGVPF
jgi:hypothetical protein